MARSRRRDRLSRALPDLRYEALDSSPLQTAERGLCRISSFFHFPFRSRPTISKRSSCLYSSQVDMCDASFAFYNPPYNKNSFFKEDCQSIKRNRTKT